MRFRVLFLVLFVQLVIGNAATDEDIDVGGLLKIGIRFVLLNLMRVKNVTITDSTTLSLPDSIKDIAIGSIKLQNVYAYGFETLDIVDLTSKDFDSSGDDKMKTNVCVNLEIGRLGVAANYDADMGILEEVPVYGNGELNLAVSKAKVDLCTNVNIEQDFSTIYVDNLIVYLQFHDSPSYITNFWKNKYGSEFATDILNVLEELLGMLVSYENECVSCVISPVVENVANSILPNDINDDLKIECPCLQELSDNLQNIEDIVEKVLDLFNDGGLSEILAEVTLNQVLTGLSQGISGVLSLLVQKGHSFD